MTHTHALLKDFTPTSGRSLPRAPLPGLPQAEKTKKEKRNKKGNGDRRKGKKEGRRKWNLRVGVRRRHWQAATRSRQAAPPRGAAPAPPSRRRAASGRRLRPLRRRRRPARSREDLMRLSALRLHCQSAGTVPGPGSPTRWAGGTVPGPGTAAHRVTATRPLGSGPVCSAVCTGQVS